MKTDDRLDTMTTEELTLELERLKDSLSDIEDMHSFFFDRTSVHIGAEKAQNMCAELEEDRKKYHERMVDIEKTLRQRR